MVPSALGVELGPEVPPAPALFLAMEQPIDVANMATATTEILLELFVLFLSRIALLSLTFELTHPEPARFLRVTTLHCAIRRRGG